MPVSAPESPEAAIQRTAWIARLVRSRRSTIAAACVLVRDSTNYRTEILNLTEDLHPEARAIILRDLEQQDDQLADAIAAIVQSETAQP